MTAGAVAVALSAVAIPGAQASAGALPAEQPLAGLLSAKNTSASPEIAAQYAAGLITPAALGMTGKIASARMHVEKEQGAITSGWAVSGPKRKTVIKLPNGAKVTSNTRGGNMIMAIDAQTAPGEGGRYFALSTQVPSKKASKLTGVKTSVVTSERDGAHIAVSVLKMKKLMTSTQVMVQQGDRLTVVAQTILPGLPVKPKKLNISKAIDLALLENAAPASLMTVEPIGPMLAGFAAGDAASALQRSLYFSMAPPRNPKKAPKVKTYGSVTLENALAALRSNNGFAGLTPMLPDETVAIAGFGDASTPSVWVRATDIPSGATVCLTAPKSSTEQLQPADCPSGLTWTNR